MVTSEYEKASGSFRDPSGQVFVQGGLVYREINISYKENYEFLLESGLYKELVEKNLLIPHEELKEEHFPNEASNDKLYKIIKPSQIDFISYPYEWSFSMLKEAALITLEINKTALRYGMILKDASAYNIQFYNGKPIFIDTLSFEKFNEKKGWIAYKQFCEHFLSPLLLIANNDVRLSLLQKTFIDGIPIDLTSSLLPWTTNLNLPLLMYIHLHAKFQKHYSGDEIKNKSDKKFSKPYVLSLSQSLEDLTKGLKLKNNLSQWEGYYSENNYTPEAFASKEEIVEGYIKQIKPGIVWDLGANVGKFSCIAAKHSKLVVSFDSDYLSVEKNYLLHTKDDYKNILPLVLDLANPSPAIGWENKERSSLFERSNADTVIALALIHHLCLGNNVPIARLPQFFSQMGGNLIIEFVPKSDSQIKYMLSSREDIFNDYDIDTFESEFKKSFSITDKVNIKDSDRVLYLMKRKQ